MILSLDGGSTSLKAGLVNKDKRSVTDQVIINRAFNYLSFCNNSAEQVITEMVSRLPGKTVKKIVAGVSGADTPQEIEYIRRELSKILQRFYKKPSLIVVNDIELVLNNTDSKFENRIAIISGTGSNCGGFNRKGQRAKAGGLDYLLSDQGSGYSVGLSALKISIEIEDGRVQHSDLKYRVYKRMGVNTGSELKKIVYSNSFTKKDIAKLALAVIESATNNDTLSNKILDHASLELFKHVKAVVTKLKIEKEHFLLIESGSMFKVTGIRKPFENLIRHNFPLATIELPQTPSFLGAINLI